MPGVHTKLCQCGRCLDRRMEAYLARVELMTEVKPRTTPDQLVPVQAHFRRHPGYLKKDPGLLKLILKGTKR